MKWQQARFSSNWKRFAHEEVLRELLTLDTTPIAGRYRETSVQQPRYRLDGVKLAVAVKGESNDVARVWLVPRHAGPGVHHGRRRFGKNLESEKNIYCLLVSCKKLVLRSYIH